MFDAFFFPVTLPFFCKEARSLRSASILAAKRGVVEVAVRI